MRDRNCGIMPGLACMALKPGGLRRLTGCQCNEAWKTRSRLVSHHRFIEPFIDPFIRRTP